jgi:hypothetical protein
VSTTTWTVPSLLKRTAFLLREHPIFALPIAVADLLGFAALHLQHALHQPLFDLFLSDSGSVLSKSHSQMILTPENASKAALLAIPLLWGCYFLSIHFYSTAMLTVSSLLSAVHDNEPLGIRLLGANLSKNKKSTLLFSVFIFGLCIVGAVVLFFLLAVVLSIPLLAHGMGFDLATIMTFLAGMVIVYFSAIPALKLLEDSGTVPRREITRLARIGGVAVLAIQSALSLFLRHALPDFLSEQSTVFGFLIREAVESLIFAFPYVLLFIALSVLVSEQPTIALQDVDLEPRNF